MELGLRDKTALVTGGSKGIGRAVAGALAAEGARVMICARDGEALARAAGEIEAATGRPVLTTTADLSELSSVARVASEAVSRLERLDILVNNAGAIKGGDFLKTPDEEWLHGWSLKLLASSPLRARFCRTLRRTGAGASFKGAGAPRPTPP